MGTTVVVTQPSYLLFVRNAIGTHGSLYEYAAAHACSELQGRGATYVVDAPGGQWVVRRCYRGGGMARLLADRHLRVGEPRPLRELRASVAARARGIMTPEVVALAVYPAGPFHRADVATRYVPDSVDLVELTFGAVAANAAGAWRATGVLIRDLAQAGIQHVDLNMKNVLITGSRLYPRAWVLDLDRASVKSKGAADAEVMFRRLQRSIEKWERKRGERVDPALRLELERGLGE